MVPSAYRGSYGQKFKLSCSLSAFITIYEANYFHREMEFNNKYTLSNGIETYYRVVSV